MNCTEFYKDLDDYLDGELNAAQAAEFDSHVQACAACQQLLAQERQRLELLRELPVAEPTAGFADRAIQAAMQTEQHLQHRRHGFVAGFGSALVAGFALWLVVGVLPQTSDSLPQSQQAQQQIAMQSQAQTSAIQQVAQQPLPQQAKEQAIPELTIALHEPQDVTLAFHSMKVLNGATIAIELPENVAIVGYPGRRSLEWQTDLDAGKNILRLPVVATGAIGGELKNTYLVAHVKHANKVTTYKINLNAATPKVSEQELLRQRIA